MSAPRPADRAPRELRRTVDEDGVVKLDLGPGGGAMRAWIAAGAMLMVVAGGAAWLGLKGAPGREAPESGDQARAHGSQRSNTDTTRNPRSRRSVPSPAGAPINAPESGDPRAPAGDQSAAGAPGAADDARDEAPEEDEGPEGRAARAGDRHLNLPEQAQAPDQKGIGAFPAPGTKRIKSGIVVPEDFPLPPGYVRHFQATDKGQMLQPILMFHPDHQPLDEAGRPIPMPADRVVPEDLAPPGLAVEYLNVPDDAYADSEGLSPEEGGSEGSGAP
jgi:hypothetical protein